MQDEPKKHPSGSKAFSSLLGALMFGGLAWWLHESWVVWPLGLLAVINGVLFISRLVGKREAA